MEDENLVTSTVTEESATNDTQEDSNAETKTNAKTVKTYSRDDVNKIAGDEYRKGYEKAKKEYEDKQEEARKLAEMDTVQKKDYEINQANKERDKYKSELEAYRLKDEAIKQATAKGVDLALMEELDYTQETAETIARKIETYEKVLNKTKEQTINQYTKEPTPQTGDRDTGILKKEDCKSYADFVKYYEQEKAKK